MNTRAKLFIAASLLMCAIHQPVLAANSSVASSVGAASAAVSDAARCAVIVTTVPAGASVGPLKPSIECGVIAPGTTRAAIAPSTTPTDATTSTAPAHIQHLELKHIVKGTLNKDLPVLVIVDKQKHFTHVLQLQNDMVTEVLCVQNSTGKPSTPTPEGRAVITQKQMDPVWVPPVSIDPQQRAVQPWSKTHRNPLGMANLRLSIDGGMIGLHGTNEPNQIGKNVSHGCIRHRNADIVKLSAIVQKGTPVYIVPSMDRAKVSLHDVLPRTTPATATAGNPHQHQS